MGPPTIILSAAKALDIWPIVEERKNRAHLYCCGPRGLMQAVRDASGRGVPIIALTDSPLSPLIEHATIAFQIPQGSVQLFRSLAVPMTFAVTFIVGLGRFLESKKARPRG